MITITIEQLIIAVLILFFVIPYVLRLYLRRKNHKDVIILHCVWLFVISIIMLTLGKTNEDISSIGSAALLTLMMIFTFYMLDSKRK